MPDFKTPSLLVDELPMNYEIETTPLNPLQTQPKGVGAPVFTLVAGTYERLLYGLDGIPSQAGGSITLKPVFIYPAHISCIKALAMSNRFLVTGSTDETVKVYDLVVRKEIGSLMHHNGTITALAFHKRTHLITASEDGNIAILRTHDWEVLKVLDGAHKHGVTGLSIHPSGRVLLSVGKEGTLKCWDLSKASCSYSMKLPRAADAVQWSKDGAYYAVLMDRTLEVYQVDSGSKCASFVHKLRINSMAFISSAVDGGEESQIVVFGTEDRLLFCMGMDGKVLASWSSGHGNRVKAISCLRAKADGEAWLISCSTDGNIRVWNLDALLKDPPTSTTLVTVLPVGEYDAGCRLTCLAVHDGIEGMTSMSSVSAKKQSYSDLESEAEELLPNNKRSRVIVTLDESGSSPAAADSIPSADTSAVSDEHKDKTLGSESKKPAASVKKVKVKKRLLSSRKAV